MNIISLNSLDDLPEAASQFVKLINRHKVFAFYGQMGAGKTTLIKAICHKLGVNENITSPTFSIVNEYFTDSENTIYHFDCYRLKNIEEAYDIGAEEYLYSGNLCFIEWPERIKSILPENTVNIQINTINDNKREIIVNFI